MDQTQAPSEYSFGAFLQQLTAGGLGYLDRRLDIEAQVALSRTQVPKITSDQTPILSYAPNQGFVSVNVGSMLPLLLVAGLVYLIVKKG